MVSEESTPTKRLRSAVKKMIEYVDAFRLVFVILTFLSDGLSSPGPSRPRGGSKKTGVIRRMDKRKYKSWTKERAKLM